MKQNIRIDMVERMFQHTSSNELVNDALKVLIPERKSIKKYFAVILSCSILAVYIAVSKDTVNIFFEIVQILNDIILALFGIVFTGYALFQALIGKEMLIRMINSTVGNGDKEKSKLQESNELFAETMMLNLICVMVNVFLLIVGKCIPVNFCLFENIDINNLIAGIGIGIYLYVITITLLEMKGFIYNIFQLFNFHAGTRVMEILNEKDEI